MISFFRNSSLVEVTGQLSWHVDFAAETELEDGEYCKTAELNSVPEFLVLPRGHWHDRMSRVRQ